jgi:hypothetical protein
LLAADAGFTGDAAGAVALAVEGQHACSQFGVLGAVSQILHLAELLLGGVDLVCAEGALQDSGERRTFGVYGVPRPS